jgi:cobalamin biosynthesis protein CbiD
MKKELKSGYTTGTHATALLVGTLYEYYNNHWYRRQSRKQL